jgi:hypothetical protein
MDYAKLKIRLMQPTQARARVTRLGDFSPVGYCLLWVVFLKIKKAAQNFTQFLTW